MLKVLTSFPRTCLIRSNIALEKRFLEVLVWSVILYYISISYFLNSWPINYYPWSYTISIGLGYLNSQIVSTEVIIDTALLLWYWYLSNHTVTGSIIATDFIFKFYFYSFLFVRWEPIRSPHSLLYGYFSASLARNLPCFLFDHFVHRQVSQLVDSFQTASIILGQYKCCQRIDSVLSIPG